MRRFLLVSVGLLGFLMLGAATDQVRAQGPCTVPKSWGRLAGLSDWSNGTVSGTRLAFEAADGTIHLVDSRCDNPPRALVVLRGEN